MTRALAVTILCCSTLIASCATYETKIGNKIRDKHGLRPQIGHVYTGIVDVAATGCFIRAPWMKETGAFIVAPINVIAILLAAPLALVTDTLMLPVDLLVTPKYPRTTFSEYCAYHAQDYLKNEG